MALGLTVEGLCCQPADDEGRSWTYLPVRADVRRHPDGSPELTWVELGSTAYLLFTASWAAAAADVDALRLAVAARVGEPDPAALRLSYAPLDEVTCRVHVTDAEGSGTREIALSTTSHVPPYDAVFNLAVRDADLIAAGSALQGQPDRLWVEYSAVRRVPVQATATFAAPGPELREWIASAGPDRDLADVLDLAVQSCIAEVRVTSYEGDVGTVATELYARLLQKVARSVLPTAVTDPRDVIVTVTVQDTVTQRVTATADIGSIIAATPALLP